MHTNSLRGTIGRKAMKIALVVFFLAASAFAQELPVLTAACGRDNVSFKVRLTAINAGIWSAPLR
jgi:hypothetical protein